MAAVLCAGLLACGDGGKNGDLDQLDGTAPDISDTSDTEPDDTDTDATVDTEPDDTDADTEPDLDTDADTEPDDGDTPPDSDSDADETDLIEEVVIPDADGDGVPDATDACPEGASGWTSTPDTDHDGDGCRDEDEDDDDDNDGIPDADDACPRGLLTGPDHDGDGCRDTEDDDDDGDGIPDEYDECPQGATGWFSTPVNDADRDGCRDEEEDDDLDGDGVPDDIDTCPGFFDPEQIDALPPYGPGQGDVCSINCRELVRYDTLEVTTTDPSLSVGPLGQPNRGLGNSAVRAPLLSDTFRRANNYFPIYPGSATYFKMQFFDYVEADETWACFVQVIEVDQVAETPLRIEISAPGTLLSDLSGASNADVLIFPSGSPTQDRDGDGLLEPWNPQNHAWILHDRPTQWHGSMAERIVRSNYSGIGMSITGPDHAGLNAAYVGSIGAHIFLTTRVNAWGEGFGRIRIFVSGELVQDFEIPPFPTGHAVYLGEFFPSPAFFIMRKRCAVTNTLCASEADCTSGPCVFRTVPRDFNAP